jgi:hypothetical protein
LISGKKSGFFGNWYQVTTQHQRSKVSPAASARYHMAFASATAITKISEPGHKGGLPHNSKGIDVSPLSIPNFKVP